VPKLVLQEHKAGREVDLGKAIRDKSDHGISCTYCHSVQHVAVRRSPDGRYKSGPVNTVTMDESGAMHGARKGATSPAHPVKVDPFIRTAEFCSQCHLNQEDGHAKTRNEGKGVLAISTYDDWKKLYDSGRLKETCIDCHMPELPGRQEVALQSPKRANTRAHSFVGAHDLDVLKHAVTLDADVRVEGDTLVVRTVAENVGAGHSVPGSGPIRAVLLKIDAWGADGKALEYVGDKDGLLHPLAGMGHPKTGERGPQHWGRQPGRMYAKPLQSPPDPKTGQRRLGVGGFAAESVAFDTTLRYREPDRAEFRFRLPAGSAPVKVQAKMVYRWAFIGLADAKGWTVEDRLMRVLLRDVRRP
jgi:hypothetical protein